MAEGNTCDNGTRHLRAVTRQIITPYTTKYLLSEFSAAPSTERTPYAQIWDVLLLQIVLRWLTTVSKQRTEPWNLLSNVPGYFSLSLITVFWSLSSKQTKKLNKFKDRMNDWVLKGRMNSSSFNVKTKVKSEKSYNLRIVALFAPLKLRSATLNITI